MKLYPSLTIQKLGGTKAVADKLHRKEATVTAWRERDWIPVDAWPGLVALAKTRALELDYTTLVDMHCDRARARAKKKQMLLDAMADG